MLKYYLLLLVISSLIGCSSIDQRLVEESRELEGAEPHSLYIPEYPDQLQSGDVLFIQREHDLEGEEYQIGDSGVFYYPHIGKVVAAGKTPGELADEMTEALKVTYKYPQVTANVTSKAGNHIFVGGEVRNNGVYETGYNMTLVQAIFMAGGFSEFAEKEQIVLLRLHPDRQYDVYVFDFDSVINIERNQRRPLRLLRGDVVYVPKKRIGNAVQFVEHYIKRLLPFDTSVGAVYNLNEKL